MNADEASGPGIGLEILNELIEYNDSDGYIFKSLEKTTKRHLCDGAGYCPEASAEKPIIIDKGEVEIYE